MIKFFKYYKWLLTFEQQCEMFLGLLKDLPRFSDEEVRNMGKSVGLTFENSDGLVYPSKYRLINVFFKPKRLVRVVRKQIIFKYYWGSDFIGVYGSSFYWIATGIITKTQDTSTKCQK